MGNTGFSIGGGDWVSPDDKICRERLKNERIKRAQAEIQSQAERARFEANMKGEKPKVYFSFGFSNLDPFTNIDWTWDMWLRFPFKVRKDKCELFKDMIQDAFETVFLA